MYQQQEFIIDEFVKHSIETTELAFVNQDMNNPLIQHQLTNVLEVDTIVRKIIRCRANTFRDAVEIAKN